MTTRSIAKRGAAMVAAILGLAIAISNAFATDGAVMYGTIPSKLPGNVASVGFEATSASELGDGVKFVADTGGRIKKVTVIMSSWGCQSGNWSLNNCISSGGSTFSVSITLHLYNFGSPTPGTSIISNTQTFDIPFRPSSSPLCIGDSAGAWYSTADKTCYNGLATPITFDFPGQGLAVPAQVVWSVSYNTTHHGLHPVGESAPCYASLGGCGYDSLNVGTESLGTLVGADLDPQGIYWNTSFGPFYCDGGPGGSFRLDSAPNPCGWQDYRPLVSIQAMSPDDCKSDGWRLFTNPAFKTQGECVSYYDKLRGVR